MEITTEKNKVIVWRFNQEVIAEGNTDSFNELMDENFINRSAPAGLDNGPQGMQYFFNHVLRPALGKVAVTIHQQLAEGDLVTTRKTISGTHSGELLGIPATGQAVNIDVIDIVRLKDGKYLEHWGITSFSDVLTQLKKV
jgi:predicted ester cyclase